jgi:hypothetical protein
VSLRSQSSISALISSSPVSACYGVMVATVRSSIVTGRCGGSNLLASHSSSGSSWTSWHKVTLSGWKPALNAFAITFADRFPAAETY